METSDITVLSDDNWIYLGVSDPKIIKTGKSVPGIVYKDYTDKTLFAVPHTGDGCMIAANLGADVTDITPFMSDRHPLIEGRYNPMKHQLKTASFITLHPRCYVLSDPRTGKTGSLILAMDYLQRYAEVTGGFLIVTTVTTIDSVWIDSIEQTLPGARIVRVHGKGREHALETPADFYITNYDSIRISGKAFTKAVLEKRIGGIVIDELTHVGNSSSQRFKALDNIVNKLNLRYAVGVTGSPADNPEAVYGMARMINRSRLPCRTKTGWLDLVTYQYGPEPFMRKPSPNAASRIYETLQPAIRFAKSSVIDLPPVVTQTRRCSMSAEQKKVHDDLKAEAVAILDSGATITAANGGVLFQKMMQMAQGFVTIDGMPVPLQHKQRTDTIIDCINETSHKVVIFGVFVFSNHQLAEELKNAGFSVGIIDGGVSAKSRAELLHNFQYAPDPRVLICHPTTTAFGVELSAADTMIFNGPPMLGGFIYAQALERLSSAKQKAPKISVIRILSSPEEEKSFKSLDEGKELGQTVSTLFEELKNEHNS